MRKAAGCLKNILPDFQVAFCRGGMASLSFQTGAAYKNKNRPEDIGRFLHWR